MKTNENEFLSKFNVETRRDFWFSKFKFESESFKSKRHLQGFTRLNTRAEIFYYFEREVMKVKYIKLA